MSADRNNVFTNKVLEKLYGKSSAFDSAEVKPETQIDCVTAPQRELKLDQTDDSQTNISVHSTPILDSGSPDTSDRRVPTVKYYGVERLSGVTHNGAASSSNKLPSDVIEGECSDCTCNSDETGKTHCIDKTAQKRTKNQKRKLKKKRRKEKLKESISSGTFVYKEHDEKSDLTTSQSVENLVDFWEETLATYCREEHIGKLPETKSPQLAMGQVLNDVLEGKAAVVDCLRKLRDALVHNPYNDLQGELCRVAQCPEINSDAAEALRVLAKYWTRNLPGVTESGCNERNNEPS